MTTARLDTELVRRGLARSRTRAAALVTGGLVTVDGCPVRRSAQPVPDTAEIVVTAGAQDDVSRGARKLAGALDDIARLAPGALDPNGARCLDAGASTGGFTQVLLRRGAAHVLAVDVGHGQLDPSIGADPRVTAVEGVNVRDLELGLVASGAAGDVPEHVGRPVDVVVADLSFISLRTVAAALVPAVRPGGQLLLLVKPQFEVGRERLGRGGVVESDALRAEAVTGVAETLVDLGVRLCGVVPSGLAGEAGNRELFLWGTRRVPEGAAVEGAAVEGAAMEGRAVEGAAVEGSAAIEGTTLSEGPGVAAWREDVRRAVVGGEPLLLGTPPVPCWARPAEGGGAR
ncbi:hemolysin [Actinotalea ferrariae CF5-4]|uniref:Hemolysin n=1 Tax=Actinotalea ferrariae CF5-4 TaxID=948458 RepID=A0A021VTD3_9CELL|nr:TlyA family RNA methyltransferase [Actinotalea ferrariae]EYR63320.1 hemolysin [Actinotalea ferrariae CF5-4]